MGKPGRKRRTGKREPNGKLSRRVVDKQARRSIDEQAAMHVGKEARERVHGVRSEDSGTELAGTVCGRLLLQGSINRQQLDAATELQSAYAAYQRAIDAPPLPRAVNIGGASGSAPEMSTAQCAKAIGRWKAAKAVLVGLDIANRGASVVNAAVDYIVLQDKYLPHMFGDLQLGLNALARHYGLMARETA